MILCLPVTFAQKSKKNKAKGTELLGNSLVHSKVNVAIAIPAHSKVAVQNVYHQQA